MARSGVTVAAIIAFLFSWNEFVYASVLVTGTGAVTLPVALSGFLFQAPQPDHLAAALLPHHRAAAVRRLLPAAAHRRDEPGRPGPLGTGGTMLSRSDG